MDLIKYSFECHVTIEPVFGSELDRLEQVANQCGFKVAKLVMLKEAADIGQPSTRDTFMTAHACDIDVMRVKMESVCKELLAAKFDILRYKIEAILIDSRINDYMEIIKK